MLFGHSSVLSKGVESDRDEVRGINYTLSSRASQSHTLVTVTFRNELFNISNIRSKVVLYYVSVSLEDH